jgi:hypothetical protein
MGGKLYFAFGFYWFETWVFHIKGETWAEVGA